MKKFFTIALALIAALMLTACSGKSLDDLIEVPDQDNTADSSDTSDKTDTDQNGDTNADTSDSNADSGDTNADTADSNTDTGNSTADTGDSGADTGDSDNDGDNTDSGNNSDNDPADSDNDNDNSDSTDSDNDDDTDSDSDDVEISDNDQENSGDDNDSTDSGSDNDADNDSGDSDNDNDPADSGNDSDSDTPETPDSDCVGISIDWNSFVMYEGAFSADAIIGDPNLEDGFSIEFAHNANGKVNVGQYDLGETKTKNRQYLTCEECVMVYMDCEVPYVFYPDNCAAYFFQERGTLNVTANDDATDKEGNIEGTLSAKLIEVELSGTEYNIDSTPVTNGRCVEIESGGTFKSTRDCLEITLDPNLTYNSSYNRYETSYDRNTGAISGPYSQDFFTMQLRNFNSSVENYSLAGTNYGDTSGIFFVIYEDYGKKYYFQKKGTVNYDASAKKVQLNGVMLEEVTITNSPKSSAMVPYGSCLKVKDTTLLY